MERRSNREFTKAQRRRLRELGGLAYERDLAAELGRLEAHFGRWRAGALDAFGLSDLVHRFHDGPARRLYLDYEERDLDFAVAHALERGVLTEAEAGPEVPELLSPHRAVLRSRHERAG